MIKDLLLRYLARRWRGPRVIIRDEGQNETASLSKASDQVSAEIIIHHPHVWRHLATRPLSLAFGEAYRNGDLIVQGDLQAILRGFYQSHTLVPPLLQALRRSLRRMSHAASAAWHLPAPQLQAVQNAQHHYDVGDDYYRLWLDESLTYSCAYFRDEYDSLERAQQQKLDLVCRKLRLAPGHTLLDIGCGWGSLLFKAVTDYGVRRAVGITASASQAHFITAAISRRRPAGRITVVQDDWRRLEVHAGTFDRIASIGFFKHVGRPHYALTLRQWHSRFTAHRAPIQAMLGEKFTRTWELYLQGAEAGFRWGDLHLWQLICLRERSPWPLDRTVVL